MLNKQRKYQQPKCLHVITCLLFSSLVLVLEWQTIQATPIITTKTGKSATATSSSSSSTASESSNRRLRINEKPLSSSARSSGRGAGAGGGISPCEHKSLSELIKTSPVILKALGAHIFNHDDDEDLRILHNSNDALLLKWQNEQNKVLTSSFKKKSTKKLQKVSTSSSSSWSSSTKTAEQTKQYQQNHHQQQQQPHLQQQQQQTFSDAATNRAALLASINADAILITLTPETIYKGASLLKMTPNAAEHTSHNIQTTDTSTSGSSGSGSSSSSSTSGSTIGSNNGNSANGGNSAGFNSASINLSEASYLYEGQLNATVQPLSCFDENLLKMLPSDLIIFGKLITIQEQQRQQNDLTLGPHDYMASSSSSQHHQQQPTKDMLKISINGLHRWSSQFENYIWKHLGWDDWSDFTVCSVACGKGVQQRFRRCLLDNPMVNLNMNFNDVEDEVDAEVEVDDDNDTMIVDDEISEQHNTIDDVDEDGDNDDDDDDMNDTDDEDSVGGNANESVEKTEAVDSKYQLAKNLTTAAATSTTPTDVNYHRASTDNVLVASDTLITGNMLHFVTTTTAKSQIKLENPTTTEEPEVMRIFEGHFNDTFSERKTGTMLVANNETSFNLYSSSSSSSSSSMSTSLKDQKDIKKSRKQKNKSRKHKSAKLYSTMFCEGYNIEQRNCNSFECSDDINDLLKFYRKYPSNEETNAASTQTIMLDTNVAVSSSSITGSTATGTFPTVTNEFGGGSPAFTTLTDANNQNTNSFTTPSNMGYIQNWHNSLNFTIMLTIRVKNDSRTTATIFSIRNSTHNLYLESNKDGLRLYLERDKTTEMLPIKLNLYDYHWHQVAISIQNGDFISIYVDCSWTNSFVVSKRLFSLPVEADVEIGRGFNGELQQLLILPEHQERFQCSDKRTSINEVKRYIIDTFIDDYSN